MAKQTTSRATTVRPRFEELRLDQQRALVARIARQRTTQLRRRYSDVVAVWSGNRSRDQRVTDEPRLIFVVAAKKPASELAKGSTLPATVSAYAIIAGRRVRIDVPTDVVEIAGFAEATPDGAPTPIEMQPPGQDLIEGQICCTVRRPELPNQLRAIGCRHVYSAQADIGADRFAAAFGFIVNDAADAPSVVETLDRLGHILPGALGGPFSFDAQLAAVNAAAKDRLRAALGDVELGNEWPKDAGELDFHDAWIHTRRGPVGVKVLGVGASVTPINYHGIMAFHRELITFELKDGDRTREGDSGAPVTTERTGGQLVGMHIASDNGKEPQTAYAIPSWALLRPQNYPGGTARETWEVVRASTLPQPAVTLPAAIVAVPGGIAPPPVPAGSLTNTYRDAFATFAMTAATQLAARAPINPTITAAQCILESAWGTSTAARSDKAYFGIKATGNFNGRSVAHRTTEDFGGGAVEIVDHFRAYDTWWHSFLDYGQLIGATRRYERARAAAGNPLAYLNEIKVAGYATDPNYVTKIAQLVNARPAILGGPI